MPAATSLDDLFAIVEAQKRSGRNYMMMETRVIHREERKMSKPKVYVPRVRQGWVRYYMSEANRRAPTIRSDP